MIETGENYIKYEYNNKNNEIVGMIYNDNKSFLKIRFL